MICPSFYHVLFLSDCMLISENLRAVFVIDVISAPIKQLKLVLFILCSFFFNEKLRLNGCLICI